MERLLVILHIYYHEQADYFISKLANISGCEWDLLVTYSSHNRDTERKLKEFKEDAVFLHAENVGYDVWPFIKAIKNTDIRKYDYILKLHTKNFQTKKWKINGLKLQGTRWRDMLVDSMLKSSEQFSRCMEIMRTQKDTGLLCSYELAVRPSNKHPEDTTLLREEAARIGLSTARERFCAGTMFIIRTVCLEKIRNAHFDLQMWASESRTHSGGTLAHVYERIFGAAVVDAGYSVRSIQTYPLSGLSVRIHTSVSPVMKRTFNIDYAEDGRKCLYLLGQKIPLRNKEKQQ